MADFCKIQVKSKKRPLRRGGAGIKNLGNQEELDEEDQGQNVGQGRNLLGFAGDHLHDGVGDQRQADTVADGAGNGHGQQHDAHGQQLGRIGKVDVLQIAQHQDTNIDQRGRGCSSGDDGCFADCQKRS